MRKKEIFPVTGLGCAACAARVGKVLNAQDGVTEANVNYASATALVEYDTDRCSPESLRKAVEEAGYGLITDVENEEEAAEAERLKPSGGRQPGLSSVRYRCSCSVCSSWTCAGDSG